MEGIGTHLLSWRTLRAEKVAPEGIEINVDFAFGDRIKIGQLGGG
jgi:hypothetical protein